MSYKIEFRYLNRLLWLILIFSMSRIFGECSDLDSLNCVQWSDYCTWNSETNECSESGGLGDTSGFGPYQFNFLTEFDGIRQSNLYNGTLLYYPLDATPPYSSIILIDAFGSEFGLQNWAEYYASHGFIAMTIGNFDDYYWDYQDRALGLLDAKITIQHENSREQSPLFNQVDTSNFSVSGYSTSGGGAHVAATLDSSLKAAVLLNPAVAFVDSVNCFPETEYYCLIEEHLDHNVPVLIFAGQYELDELVSEDDSIYADIWALPQYEYVPATTKKVYFESGGEGHGSSFIPTGDVGEYALAWLHYNMLGDNSYFDYLITQPTSTSQFLNTLNDDFTTISYDVNGDGETNNTDFIMLLVFTLNDENSILSADINFDSDIDIYDLLLLADHLIE